MPKCCLRFLSYSAKIKVNSLYLGGEVSEGPALQVADPGVKNQEGDLQGSRRTDWGGTTGEYCQGSLQGLNNYKTYSSWKGL